jgi:hypothetical protein
VQAAFENLLPDSEHLRRAVAEKVGARGTDALQTTKRARLSEALVAGVLKEVAESAASAIATVEGQLPADFPAGIHTSITGGIRSRLPKLEARAG